MSVDEYGWGTRNMYRGPDAVLAGVDYDPAVKPKKLARNTVKYRHRDGSTRYRLHRTDIVTVSADGREVTLATGGYLTVTTRARLEMVARALHLAPHIGSCYGGRAFTYRETPFTDSLTIRGGIPVVTPDLEADVAAARDAYNAARAATRKRNYARARERRRERRDAEYMRAVGMTYDAYQQMRRDYRAAVKAASKESANVRHAH